MPSSQTQPTRHALAALALAAAALLAGCRQDMQNQPKFYPQRGTTFYADGRSVRPQLPNTVAREQGDAQSYFLTGMVPGPGGTQEGDGMPLPVTPALLARGQERFNVYCSPCHSRTGYGHGMIVQRGYAAAANFHAERLRAAPLGHFFSVITNGYGAMPEYRAQVAPADRWAIVAYIRALQLSQNAAATDAPAGTAPKPLAEIVQQGGYRPDFASTRYWTASTAAPLPDATPSPAASTAPAATADASTTTAATQPAATKSPEAVTPAATPSATKPLTSASGPAAAATTKPAAPPKPPAPKGNAAAGKDLYAANCSICHQESLEGRPPKIPALLGVVARTGEDHVRTTITEGRPDARPMMPAFGTRLTDADIDNLVAYLRTTKSPE